jgi:site-specific DNA recombinase
VVLTPEGGDLSIDLSIDLRGELASMLSLCAGAETQKASAGDPLEALQIKFGCGDRI